MTASRSIVIVGGGASGVILAAQLMRSGDPALRVTLVERSEDVGKGIAYSTGLPAHRLNVLAGRMSALPQEPDHFRDWLAARGHLPDDQADVFAPRQLYGAYLGELFDTLIELNPSRLRRVHDECIAIRPNPSGLDIRLSGGMSIAAHAAVLAIGHDAEPDPQNALAVKIGSDRDGPLDPEERIVILGSGLSMIDAWLTLRERGHRGEVVVISRRGLLPQPHGTVRKPVRLDMADIPLGTELSYFARWFHEMIETDGGRWRDVIDGIRPFNQKIWQNWPTTAKRRFLEHTKAWWDIHRHRIAPDLHEEAMLAIERNRLKLLAAKIVDMRQDGTRIEVELRRRFATETETLTCARVYDCTGLIRDPATSSSILIKDLMTEGLARPDPLKLGLDVTPDMALRNAEDTESERIFAVGPLTRGTFFEIEAVPEIREQAARLATGLTN